MPFEKGNNLGGRTNGSLSAKTKQWNELGEFIANEGAKKYLSIIMKLSDDEFQDRYEKILEYFKPKLQRSEIEIKESINWSEIPLEDRKVLNTLNDKYQLN